MALIEQWLYQRKIQGKQPAPCRDHDFLRCIINLPHLFVCLFPSHPCMAWNSLLPDEIMAHPREEAKNAHETVRMESSKTAAALYLTNLLIAYKILLTDIGYWFPLGGCR